MFILGIIYLSIPVFLVLFTFFSAPFVLLSTAALILLVFCLYKSHYEGSNIDLHLQTLYRYWPLLLVSLTVTYLSLVYPFKRQDWGKNFAVLNALIGESWLPVIELNEQTWFLRYCVAWYALPALFAKILGLQSLTVVMIIWTVTGFFIALVLAFHNTRKTRPLTIGALVFFFFSGLDIVGVFFNHHVEPVTPWWLHWQTRWGYIGSNLAHIAWSPQHIAGTCVAASLFIYNRCLALKYSGVIVVMTALWSPFSAIGLVPVVVWAVFKEGYKLAFSLQNYLIAPLLGLSILLYLTQGSGQIPFIFVWEHPQFSLTSLILFCAVEFLLILGVLYWFEREERALIVILASSLLLFCFLHWGTLNELLAKGTIPATCIIAILVTKSLLKSFKNGGWHREILVAYLVAGAFPIAVAFVMGLSMDRVDKRMTFNELASIYSEETDLFIAHQYLVKTEDVTKAFGIPLLRGLPEKQKGQKDTR